MFYLGNYNELSGFIKRHSRILLCFLSVRKCLNIVKALVEMKLRRVACNSRPFVFRIEPCSVCNLRCPTCESHTSKTTEKRVMDLGDFKKIIDRIEKYAIRTSLYDMGEPLMNKNIYDMIGYVSDRRISTLISTNFNLFGRENIEDLFRSRLTVLEPCLDGYSQEAYEKYRVQGHVDTVKSGIKMVMDEKRARGSKWPYVDVQVIAFDHIMHELDDVTSFLEDCKVDKVTLRQENLGFNSPETTVANQVETGKQACFWLYLGMMIRPDGNVYPCCGMNFDRFSYGNILQQELDEIWNNDYYRFSRKLFKEGADLEFDADMVDIPCLACDKFKKRRIMKGATPGQASKTSEAEATAAS